MAASRTQDENATSTLIPIERATSIGFDAVGSQPRMALDRPARPLTYELANHVKAYLEASQCKDCVRSESIPADSSVDTSGFAFLNTLLTTNTSISTPAKRYHTYIAQAPQLALAATLVVYPHITTKAKSPDYIKGSDAALQYLHSVQSTVSPLHDTLRRAFAFPDDRSRRNTAGYRTGGDRSSPNSEIDFERLSGPPANEQSLWYRASDFWHIVGWAFNCSVAHKKRWRRWKLWLEVIITFLETNWSAQLRRGKLEGEDEEKYLMDTLLWHYISNEDPTNRGNRRRMVRAILARGTSQCKTMFSEVWSKETAEPKPAKVDKALPELDVDNGMFGDFQKFDEDEPMYDAPNTTRKSRRARSSRLQTSRSDEDDGSVEEDDALAIHTVEDAINSLGGIDAVILRQRLIALLAQVAQALPANFTPVGELFDPITEEFTHLPSMVFSVLLSTSKLSDLMQTALNANLLLPLVTGQLPDYTKIEPTQAHLVLYLLPRRATTQSFATNAKISLILEQIFRYMMSIKALQPTEELRKAVEQGVQERDSAYGTAKGKKGNAHEEEQSKTLLEASAQRLLGLLELLEVSHGKEPQGPSGKKSFSISFGSELSDLSSVPDSDPVA
jgi:hypothetical protein